MLNGLQSSPHSENRPTNLLIGNLGGYHVAFLPRHGRGHRVSPSEVNYRANIDALKRVGADRILSFSAVGSLKEELAPGTFVLVDQYIDRTSGRESSFFGEGFVAHVSMADPVCSTMNDAVQRRRRTTLSINFVRGGTYLGDERSAILNTSRVEFVSLLERRHYRNDKYAGGQTGP